MAVMCLLLAKNQSVQDRLYTEIQDAVEANNGSPDLDYNVIQGLPYLDQAINETIRYHPQTILERQCTRDYKVPGTELVLTKGMLVQVPSAALMRDAKFFPFPNEFNPDNFSPENRADRSPYVFLGFGQGPRNCVGMRFALLQVKVAMVRVVGRYKLLTGPRTPDKIVHEPMSQASLPKGGAWVRVEPRQDDDTNNKKLN